MFLLNSYIMHVYTNSSKQTGQINLLLNQPAVEQLHSVWTNRVTWEGGVTSSIAIFSTPRPPLKKSGKQLFARIATIRAISGGRCISISEVESLLRQVANDKRVCGGGGLDHSPTTNDSSKIVPLPSDKVTFWFPLISALLKSLNVPAAFCRAISPQSAADPLLDRIYLRCVVVDKYNTNIK